MKTLPIVDRLDRPKLIWEGVMPHTAVDSPMTPYKASENHALNKLVLVVAESCNLRCTYCYAEGGPYGKTVSVMSKETARDSIRRIFTKYSPIKILQFFGGEPTLNLGAMQAAADEVRSLTVKQNITTLTRFAIQTNAFRMTKELINFYHETDMIITVSHDCPEEVQNTLRPGTHGEASFDTVSANLNRLRDENIEFDIECTYTRKHASTGYRIPDLVEYFQNLGARLVHIVPVSVPKGNYLDVYFSEYFEDMVQGYREATRTSFCALQEGHNIHFGMFAETVKLVVGKTGSEHYCNAGVTTLTVAANGDVYPCFMFINKKGFLLGHVNGEHSLAGFARNPKDGMDYGCPGREFMMNGKIVPFSPDQILKQAVMDEVVIGISAYLDEIETEMGITRKQIQRNHYQLVSTVKSLVGLIVDTVDGEAPSVI